MREYILKKGKKEAQEIYEQILMTLDQNSGIIDGNNIYENWNENEEIQKELEGFSEAYFNVLSVFYEAFTGLASTLDFGEEKINCLRNSLHFSGLSESYLKLLEIALDEFRRQKLLNKEVVDIELRDALLSHFKYCNKESSFYKKIIRLFSQNEDFLIIS